MFPCKRRVEKRDMNLFSIAGVMGSIMHCVGYDGQ